MNIKSDRYCQTHITSDRPDLERAKQTNEPRQIPHHQHPNNRPHPIPYKSSTFRGSFGHALRRVMCVNRGETCMKYPFKTACVYTYIFETTPRQAMDGTSEDAHRPHQFIIEPPMSEKRHYSRDDSVERSRVVDAMNLICEKETRIHDSNSNIRDSQMIDPTSTIHEVSQLNHHPIPFTLSPP